MATGSWEARHGLGQGVPQGLEAAQGPRAHDHGHEGEALEQDLEEGQLDLDGVLPPVGQGIVHRLGQRAHESPRELLVHGHVAQGRPPRAAAGGRDGCAEARVVGAEDDEARGEVHARIDAPGRGPRVDVPGVRHDDGGGSHRGEGPDEESLHGRPELIGVRGVEGPRHGGRPDGLRSYGHGLLPGPRPRPARPRYHREPAPSKGARNPSPARVSGSVGRFYRGFIRGSGGDRSPL